MKRQFLLNKPLLVELLEIIMIQQCKFFITLLYGIQTSSKLLDKYLILVKTLQHRKDLALYVRNLNLRNDVPGLLEVLVNCSELTAFDIGYLLVDTVSSIPGEEPLFKNLKSLKIDVHGMCDHKVVLKLIEKIAGQKLDKLYLHSITESGGLPSNPSLPFQISTFTSFGTKLSTLTPLLPIQSNSLLQLHLHLQGPVHSFEILKSFSKLQYLKIIGDWNWAGMKEGAYDIFAYFPDLIELELRHPERISIEAFSLLLATSPNITKIDLTTSFWTHNPQMKISAELSSILKGKKLEFVELGSLACSTEEVESMLRLSKI